MTWTLMYGYSLPTVGTCAVPLIKNAHQFRMQNPFPNLVCRPPISRNERSGHQSHRRGIVIKCLAFVNLRMHRVGRNPCNFSHSNRSSRTRAVLSMEKMGETEFNGTVWDTCSLFFFFFLVSNQYTLLANKSTLSLNI